MNRTKLRDRKLPNYSRGEEIFNMTSHIVGGALGIVAVVLCVVFAAVSHNKMGVISGAIYGFTMILLYTMSSIYHGLSPQKFAKRVFQVLDHCSIFLLIAGTYTPITLCSYREYKSWYGWLMFGIIWAMAALGIALNSIDIKKYSKFSMICYMGMGWVVVFTAKILPLVMDKNAIILLALGGVSYTVGAILYGIGKKHKWMHSVFHIFVVIGSLLHFFMILFYVVK
jgi:hemolysin III